MVIVGITVIFKHSILINCNDSIKQLLKILDEDYKAAELYGEREKDIILKSAMSGVKICRFWLVSATLTCFMFPAKAIIEMGNLYMRGEFKLVPMFDFTYPNFIEVHKESTVAYTVLFLMCLSFDLFSLSIYIGFDPLVPIFMLHTCGQLELISNKLVNVFSKDASRQDIVDDLKRINVKLQNIYKFVKMVQNIFIILYEFNMKTTTFLLPFSVFQIMQSLRNREISLEFIFFFSGACLHFYMPCYYSNLLMEKSESLRNAIYFSGWESRRDIGIRKTILLMLTRTYVPLGIKTVFYPICLDTFAEMVRQAYGIYNIMNAAWG
ncbi:putative odorant receptor OR30 [Danaus plexippus plexippus]|uniref:Odorant receptor OR30 n=1 Tax=Danaus plexippus plexippus TaxID=278856 RepID=A0A212F883_DANPL|nr:putative odorant receptor OR30 [Danaus plexippus plexippus]